MIRRDYILRMIEECIRALASLDLLKRARRWDEASEELDAEFKKLFGDDVQTLARFSENELLARLMRDGPTYALREKTLILATYLKEAGDLAMAENRAEAGRECYLKALHLLLHTMGLDEPSECPEFVPKVELLREMLQETALPARTQAMLMQHYERTGEFAKAEDALFALLDAEPDNDVIAGFGVEFYQRLLAQSDTMLSDGNLPRAEVEEGLKALQARRKGGAS